MSAAPPGLSRRALLGAGLARLVRARSDEAEEQGERGGPARPCFRSAAAAERLVAALRLAQGERVLVLAAGDGDVARAAARRGAEVTAVDTSPALVEHSRERVPQAAWRVAGRRSLPFPAGSFDCVASAFGLVDGGDVRGALAEAERVLRPGGRLALATWSSAGAMGAVLRAAPGGAAVARWGTYEGLQRALDRFAAFEVREEELTWRYEEAAALRAELGRADLESFLRRREGEAIELRVGWCLTVATRLA